MASISAITPAGFDVIDIVGWDEARGCVYFVASPDDPLRRYLFAATVDGSSVERVTPRTVQLEGTNSYTLSKDCCFAVHTFSSCNQPSVTSIVELPSHKVTLSLAQNAKLEQMFRSVDLSPVEFLKVPIEIPGDLGTGTGTRAGSGSEGREGVGKGVLLDAWCLRPPGFDPSLKYPVIFHVYGEPAAQIVRDQWGGRLALWHRMLAQRGCVVVCMDNRGTPCPRGRIWRKCVYGQVGTLGSADQAAGVRAILEAHPYLDTSRVGVWGWSGGGSMSLNALFRYPELYQNAVVVAPVPDMRLYDTIYQERYMGLPAENPEGYRLGSPVTFAPQMSPDANLLLVHGTGDDNCHYQGMEVLINELVRQNKPFQMMAYPNRSHSISEGANTTLHLFETITRFLTQCGLIQHAVGKK